MSRGLSRGCTGSRALLGGEVLRIPAKLFGPQPLAAVTTVFAVGIIMPSMISTGGQSSGQASGAKSASHARAANGAVWARTVSGRKVLVPKPTFATTPIHPVKITHPNADTMGAVTAAHAPWPRSARVTPVAAAAVPQLPGITSAHTRATSTGERWLPT